MNAGMSSSPLSVPIIAKRRRLLLKTLVYIGVLILGVFLVYEWSTNTSNVLGKKIARTFFQTKSGKAHYLAGIKCAFVLHEQYREPEPLNPETELLSWSFDQDKHKFVLDVKYSWHDKHDFRVIYWVTGNLHVSEDGGTYRFEESGRSPLL